MAGGTTDRTLYLEILSNFDARELILDDAGNAKDALGEPIYPALDRATVATCGCDENIYTCLPSSNGFNYSLSYQIDLGSIEGESVGYLSIYAKEPDATVDLGSTELLFQMIGSGVEIQDSTGNPAADGLFDDDGDKIVPLAAGSDWGWVELDVDPNGDNAYEYHILFKRPNGTVYRTVRVEDPDADGGGDKMHFSETMAIDGQSATRVWHFEWDDTEKGWILREGIDNSGTATYERVTRRESTTSGNTRTETVTIEESAANGGGEVSKVTEVYRLVGTGEKLVERIVDPDGLALREVWTYDTGSSTYGELSSYLSPTGYWERYTYDYDYAAAEDYLYQKTVVRRLGDNLLGGDDDAADNVEVVTSAWAVTLYDGLAGEEDVTIERVLTRVEGVDTALRYQIMRDGGSTVSGCREKWDVTFVDANPEAGGASVKADIIELAEDLLDGSFTGEAIVAKYWHWDDAGQITDDSRRDDLKQVLLSNGNMTFYERTESGNNRTTVYSDGIPNSAGTAIVTGRRTTRTVDERNSLVSLLTEQIAEGQNSDAWFVVSLVKASVPDGVGRPQREDFYFGVEAKAEWDTPASGTASYYTVQAYGCCGGASLSSFTNRSGTVRTTEQDILGRTFKTVMGSGSTSAELETEYAFDAAGRVLTTTNKPLSGSGQPDLVSSVTYNMAGQVIESTDEEGRKTYFRYRRVEADGDYYSPASSGDVYYFETLVFGHDNTAPVSVTWTDGFGNTVLESTASSTANWPPSTDPAMLPALTEHSRMVYVYDWANRPVETRVYHNLTGIADGGLAAPGTPGTHYLVVQAQAYDPAGRPTSTTDAIGNVLETIYAENSFRGMGTRMGITGNTVDVARVFYQEHEAGNTDTNPQGPARPYMTRSYSVRANLLETPEEDGNGNLSDYTYTDMWQEYEVSGGALVKRRSWTRPASGGGVWAVTEYNAQGQRIAERTTENGNASNVLTAETFTYHPLSGAPNRVDHNGQLAHIDRWHGGNEAGTSIRTALHYDDADRIVKTETSGGGFSKVAFDAYGRVVREVFASSEGGTDDPLNFTGDVVLTETVTGYNKAEQTIQTTAYHRAHDATATGLLSSAAASQSRVSYGAVWFDDNGRATHSAGYGNNGGAAFSRPASAPEPNTSDDVLVSKVSYDAAGYPYLTTANDGIQSRTYYNAAGQVTFVVENYDADSQYWDNTAEDPGNPDDRQPTGADIHNDINRITAYVYDHSVTSGGGGQLTQVIRVDPDGDGDRADDQATHYINSGEITASFRGYVPRNGRPAAVLYPDALVATSRAAAITAMNTHGDTSGGASGGGDFATVQLYADGKRYRFTDRRGVAWTTEYTATGQVAHRRVTATGNWTAVGDRRVAYTYGDAGEVLTATSYSDSAGATATSKIAYTYDGFYNRLTDTQNHDPAAVGGGTGLAVAYAYDTTASNGQYTHGYRMDQLTYPNGREVGLVYDGHGGIDAVIGRANGIDEVIGGVSTPVTRYSYLGSGAMVRKDYPGPDVRLDFIDEGAEGSSGSDSYDASLNRLGRVERFQWERYDSNGDGAGVAGADGEDIIHTSHAYDRVGQKLYDRRHVYAGYSSVYRHDDLHRVTGRDVGPINVDGSNDVVLDVDGFASVDDFWKVNGRDTEMDQLGNPLSVDTESAVGHESATYNDANEIETYTSYATRGAAEVANHFSNPGDEDIFTEFHNATAGNLSVSGGLMAVNAGSPTAPAVLLTGEDRSTLSFASNLQSPSATGLVGVVFGYKSALDYWVWAIDFETGSATHGDWVVYHMHDADGNGSIDYTDAAEKELVLTRPLNYTALNTGYSIYSRSLANTLDYASSYLLIPGGLPSGKFGLYTEVPNAKYNYFRVVSDMRTASLGAAWETTNANDLYANASGDGRIETYGTWHRQYKPVLLRGLHARRFQATFSMGRRSSHPYGAGQFVFNVRGPGDMDRIIFRHNATGTAPEASSVRGGRVGSALTEDRNNANVPGRAATEKLWVRVVSDGVDVKVFAATTEAGLDTVQSNDDWCMRTTASTDRFAFSDGVGRMGFMGGSYSQHWDNITVQTDTDNDADLTDPATYETTEIVETFDLTNGKIEDTFVYDANGNLTFDGAFRYTYDALNRLVEVRMAGESATIPGSVMASYRYDALGRLIEEKEYSAEGVQIVIHNVYDGWNLIETRDGAANGGRVTTQNIWDSLAGHTIDSMAQVAHNLNLGIDDDPSASGTQDWIDARLFVLQDQLANVTALVTAKGDLVERYEYDQNGRRYTYQRAGTDYDKFAAADLDNDGWVDSDDFNLMAANYGTSVTPGDRTKGDVNGDGLVNLSDFSLIAGTFGVFGVASNDTLVLAPAGGSHAMDFGPSSGQPLMRHGMQGHVQDDRLGLVHMRRRAFTTQTASGGGAGRFMQRDPEGYTDGGHLYHAYFQSWQTTDPMGLSAGGGVKEKVGYMRFRELEPDVMPGGDTWYHFILEKYVVTGTRQVTRLAGGRGGSYQYTATEDVKEWVAIINHNPEVPGPGFDECYEGQRDQMIRSVENWRNTFCNLAEGNNQSVDDVARSTALVSALEITLSLVPFGNCADLAAQGKYKEALISGTIDLALELGTFGAGKAFKAVRAAQQARRIANAGAATKAAGGGLVAGAIARSGDDVAGEFRHALDLAPSSQGTHFAPGIDPLCFTAGTPVATPDGGEVPIEQLRPGMRVRTPRGQLDTDGDGEPDDPGTAVEPETWRLVHLELDHVWEDGTIDVVQIKTLKPLTWIEQHGAAVGALVPTPLDLAEMGLPESHARVVAIESCPAIESGPGRVVLTTVNHLNRDVCELTIRNAAGVEETLEPTLSHPFWSQDRRAWIPAGQLQYGERLVDSRGCVLTLISRRLEPGTHRVYNLTVETEHVYYVGRYAILVHNTCVEDAIKARDEFIDIVRRAADEGRIPRNQLNDITTVVGGVNKNTGDVFVGVNRSSLNNGTRCAEDLVVDALGGKVDDIIMTPAVRPRNLSVVPVCRRCQGRYPRRSFMPGTEFKPPPTPDIPAP